MQTSPVASAAVDASSEFRVHSGVLEGQYSITGQMTILVFEYQHRLDQRHDSNNYGASNFKDLHLHDMKATGT